MRRLLRPRDADIGDMDSANYGEGARQGQDPGEEYLAVCSV